MSGFFRVGRGKLRFFGFEYEESKHKRDESGKWATKEGAGEGDAGDGGELGHEGLGWSIGNSLSERDMRTHGWVNHKPTKREFDRVIGAIDGALSRLNPEILERVRKRPLKTEIAFVRRAPGATDAASGGHGIVGRDTSVIAVNAKWKPTAFEKGLMVDASQEGAARHELGHSIMPEVYDEIVDSEFFIQDWQPSEYGTMNPQEKWAEFFAMATSPGFDPSPLPKKVRTLYDSIFIGAS